MRVLLSACGTRGDVEPLAGLGVRLRALGAEVRVCAPPDKEFAELLAGVGVPRSLAQSPLPPDVTDKRVLWDPDAQSANALFGAALNTHQVRHAGPGALLRPMVASDLRSELMT